MCHVGEMLHEAHGTLVPFATLEELSRVETLGYRDFAGFRAAEAAATIVRADKVESSCGTRAGSNGELLKIVAKGRTGPQNPYILQGLTGNYICTAESVISDIHKRGGRVVIVLAPKAVPQSDQRLVTLTVSIGTSHLQPSFTPSVYDDAASFRWVEDAALIRIGYGLHKSNGGLHTPADFQSFADAYHTIRDEVDSPWHLDADTTRMPATALDLQANNHYSAQFGYTCRRARLKVGVCTTNHQRIAIHIAIRAVRAIRTVCTVRTTCDQCQ